MSGVVVECVANFSEGRDPATLAAIRSAIEGAGGSAVLLGSEADPDHNRSVFTFAGTAEAVKNAAVRAVGVAAARIDLTRQQGQHPRIGAADVVPFVPVRGIGLAACVELAWAAGDEIWQRYGVPVYFYGAAAKVPERERLENIRRGQFEGLSQELCLSSDRAPDLGLGRLHPTAGATVVGARKFLIAYNINLATADIEIAKAIARKIRASSGGMLCVKALGVMLESRGLAQVSMNLTDFEVTSVDSVFDAVKREAAALGVAVAETELIGFIPRAAVGLQAFAPETILENALDAKLRA